MLVFSIDVQNIYCRKEAIFQIIASFFIILLPIVVANDIHSVMLA